ncbi:MAG: YdeI/OmpD-associated family protein [Flavobacteriales bacterium]
MSATTFTSRLERIDSDLWQHLFYVPDDIAEQFIEGDNRRVICTIKGLKPYSCALMYGNDGKYILVNGERRKKLGLVPGEVIEVTLEKDTSEFGMDMSEEFREVLYQSDEAREVFMSLTRGRQRTLIYWADNVKSPEIKIRRALVLMEHLAESRGELDFKLLNVKIKEANQQAKLH